MMLNVSGWTLPPLPSNSLMSRLFTGEMSNSFIWMYFHPLSTVSVSHSANCLHGLASPQHHSLSLRLINHILELRKLELEHAESVCSWCSIRNWKWASAFSLCLKFQIWIPNLCSGTTPTLISYRQSPRGASAKGWYIGWWSKPGTLDCRWVSVICWTSLSLFPATSLWLMQPWSWPHRSWNSEFLPRTSLFMPLPLIQSIHLEIWNSISISVDFNLL